MAAETRSPHCFLYSALGRQGGEVSGVSEDAVPCHLKVFLGCCLGATVIRTLFRLDLRHAAVLAVIIFMSSNLLSVLSRGVTAL